MKGHIRTLTNTLGPIGLGAALIFSMGCIPEKEAAAQFRAVTVTVSGLNAMESVKLSLNGEQSITVDDNIEKDFPLELQDGNAYTVTVDTVPVGRKCDVTDGAGVVAASMPLVDVACSDILIVDITEDPLLVPDANLVACIVSQATDQVATYVHELTSLECNGINILDPTGIEWFTAIETLYLVSDGLTAIDVSPFKLLKNLTLAINNLTAVDLSANKLLLVVDLSENSLEDISFAGNTHLREAYLLNQTTGSWTDWATTEAYLIGLNGSTNADGLSINIYY